MKLAQSARIGRSERIEMVGSIDVAKCDSAGTRSGNGSPHVDGYESGHHSGYRSGPHSLHHSGPGMEALCASATSGGVLGDMISSVTPSPNVVPIPDMDVVPVLPGSNTNTPELMGDGP